MSILRLKDISYSYNKSYEKILRNVEMEFEEGKFYTIIWKINIIIAFRRFR